MTSGPDNEAINKTAETIVEKVDEKKLLEKVFDQVTKAHPFFMPFIIYWMLWNLKFIGTVFFDKAEAFTLLKNNYLKCNRLIEMPLIAFISVGIIWIIYSKYLKEEKANFFQSLTWIKYLKWIKYLRGPIVFVLIWLLFNGAVVFTGKINYADIINVDRTVLMPMLSAALSTIFWVTFVNHFENIKLKIQKAVLKENKKLRKENKELKELEEAIEEAENERTLKEAAINERDDERTLKEAAEKERDDERMLKEAAEAKISALGALGKLNEQNGLNKENVTNLKEMLKVRNASSHSSLTSKEKEEIETIINDLPKKSDAKRLLCAIDELLRYGNDGKLRSRERGEEENNLVRIARKYRNNMGMASAVQFYNNIVDLGLLNIKTRLVEKLSNGNW